MPLDEPSNLSPSIHWPPLDNSLLGEARPALPAFPLHLIPGCSFDTGLGLFALRGLAPGTIARHGSQVLRGAKRPKGRNLLFGETPAQSG